MNEEQKQKIAKMLNDNLGNRMTVELATGIFQAIINTVGEVEPELDIEPPPNFRV